MQQQSQGQAFQEQTRAAGAMQQDTGATEQQGDSASKVEQEKEAEQGSRASEDLDVRWDERLVLELPPDTEEDEVRMLVPSISCNNHDLACDM